MAACTMILPPWEEEEEGCCWGPERWKLWSRRVEAALLFMGFFCLQLRMEGRKDLKPGFGVW